VSSRKECAGFTVKWMRKSDMRIKAIIDDGTGALMIVLDSRLTQKIMWNYHRRSSKDRTNSNVPESSGR